MLQSNIIIQVFNRDGELISDDLLSVGEWYDGEHPAVDSQQARVRMGVSRIHGWQYDYGGNLRRRWQRRFSEDGSPISDREWHEDGSITESYWSGGVEQKVHRPSESAN